MINFVALEKGKYPSALESGDQGQLTNPLLDLTVDGMFNNENGHISDFISLLESDNQSEITALLSHTEEMSERNITSLMFAASFPCVTAEVFKQVVDAVLRWGDRFRGTERQRFENLRDDPDAFEDAIYWVVSGNRILELMDARLSPTEANKLTRGKTPLHLAVEYKKLNGEPDFPEYAVIRYLTASYSPDPTKCDSSNLESAFDCARGMSDPFLLSIMTEATKRKTIRSLLIIPNNGLPITVVRSDDILRENLDHTYPPNGESLLRILSKAVALQEGVCNEKQSTHSTATAKGELP